MLTDEGVKNVAPCYHCTSVRVGNKDDDLYSRARKRTDLQASTKWRAKKGCAGVLNRMALIILDNEGSQSSTYGNGNPPEEQPQNRIHKRVIMSGEGSSSFSRVLELGSCKG
jgi:hypothetical protein